MQHALDAAEVDERAVVLERRDAPLDDRTDGERAAQFGRARRLLRFEQRAPRHDDVGAAPRLLVARDAPLQLLSDEGAGVLGVAQIELRDRAERAHAADHHVDAAFVDGTYCTFDRKSVRERRFELARAVGAAPAERALEHDAAFAPADLDDGRGELVALFDRQRAVAIAQLRELDDAVTILAPMSTNAASRPIEMMRPRTSSPTAGSLRFFLLRPVSGPSYSASSRANSFSSPESSGAMGRVVYNG